LEDGLQRKQQKTHMITINTTQLIEIS